MFNAIINYSYNLVSEDPRHVFMMFPALSRPIMADTCSQHGLDTFPQ